MTKKEVLAQIKELLSETERVFFTSSIGSMRKADLQLKLETLQLLLIAQEKYNALVNTLGLTTDDLLNIALNGPQDKLEREAVVWQGLVSEYVARFEA